MHASEFQSKLKFYLLNQLRASRTAQLFKAASHSNVNINTSKVRCVCAFEHPKMADEDGIDLKMADIAILVSTSTLHLHCPGYYVRNANSSTRRWKIPISRIRACICVMVVDMCVCLGLRLCCLSEPTFSSRHLAMRDQCMKKYSNLNIKGKNI